MARKRNRGEYVSLWVSAELAADLACIADLRTSGNRSAAVRHLLAWAVRREAQGMVRWTIWEDGYEAE